MVLFAHLKSISVLSWIPDVTGTAGVGIFFAMSGFLITRILIADRAAGRELATFYNRRAARILPIYYLTLGAVRLFSRGEEFRQVATFSFNFCFLAGSRDYFQRVGGGDSTPPLAHYWSLCVEEHFYWLWPLAVAFLPWFLVSRLPLVIVAVTPFVSSFAAGYLSRAGFSPVEIEGLLSRMTLTQLPAISIGAFIAIHETWLRDPLKRSRPLIAGLLLCAAGAAWFGLGRLLPAEVVRCTSTTALHLICAGIFLSALGLPLLGEFRALRHVGAISYGLYLFHLPIYSYCGILDVTKPVRTHSGLIALGLTFGLAVISFRCIEAPIMAFFRSREGSAGRPQVRYFGLFTTGALALLFGFSFRGAPTAEMPRKIEAVIAAAQQAPQIDPKTIHTIILGSSHADFGVACGELSDSAYNLASVSQDLWYDNKITHRMIERMPQLKRVIFTVSVFSFRHALCDAEEWRQGLYERLWQIPTRDGQPREIATCDGLSNMISKTLLVDEPNRGWTPLERPAELNVAIAAKVAERHNVPPDHRIADNFALLKDAIQACQARKIECILLTTPTHEAYRKAASLDRVQETERLIAEIESSTGVLRLDYSADDNFAAEDFYDVDHLNRDGAIKFTRLLDYDLQNLGTRQRTETRISGRSSAIRK